MALELLVEPDDRGRVSLARVPGAVAERYIAQPLPGGSLLLQPAVVMSRQAVESLLEIIELRATTPPQGKMLSEVLDRIGRSEISEERMAEIRAHVAQRRKQGFRSLADLTQPEIDALKAGQAGVRREASKAAD